MEFLQVARRSASNLVWARFIIRKLSRQQLAFAATGISISRS
jgi:hypothetical protein